MTAPDARMKLKHLTYCFGVKPQALLLPRQPGCGRVRVCELGSLQALVDLMIGEGGHDISRHTKVFAAHHSPKKLCVGQSRVFHRPAIPCYARFAAQIFFPGHKLANIIPNMAPTSSGMPKQAPNWRLGLSSSSCLAHQETFTVTL